VSNRIAFPRAARRRSAASALVALAVALGGCGYALVGHGSNVPESIRSVYIAPLVNRTQRSQVDQILTRAIADEMVTRRRFAVVNGLDGADAELSGEVVGFGLTPVSFDQQGRATEYEISITVSVKFRRTDRDEVIWSNDRYLFRENYPVDPSRTDYLDRENQAIEDASKRFAETMISDLLEGF
jgi:outer membrane lipopolysaccharide assembly protein LptE/RlpB